MTQKADHDVDELIREALTEEERAWLDQLEEPSLPMLLTEVFRTRMRWPALLSSVFAIGCFFAAIWCGWHFFTSRDTADLLHWGAGLLLFFSATMAIKLWYWQDLQRLSLIRELKRVQLQVAALNQHLRHHRG